MLRSGEETSKKAVKVSKNTVDDGNRVICRKNLTGLTLTFLCRLLFDSLNLFDFDSKLKVVLGKKIFRPKWDQIKQNDASVGIKFI